MRLLKVTLLLHLFGGLAAALFLIILAFTGAILVFENEIDHWLNSRTSWVTPAGAKLPLDVLRVNAERLHPGHKVTVIAIPPDDRLSLALTLRAAAGAKQMGLFINPYTGEELGTLADRNHFTQSVHQLHTNLLLGPLGKQITAISACILFLLSVSGVILWWPAKKWRLRFTNPSARRMLDWHHVIGIYSAAFLFLFAVTGMVIHWDEELRGLLNGFAHAEDAPIPAKGLAFPSPLRQSPDQLLALAQEAVPGAQVTSIQGIAGNSPVRITMKFPEDHTPAGRTNLYLDPSTGAVLSAQTSRVAPIGTRIVKLWNREIHTGEIGGWPTRVIAFLACLALPVLAVTGPLIWWSRWRRRASA